MPTFSGFVGSSMPSSSVSSSSSVESEESSRYPLWKDMDTTAKKIGWIAGAIIYFPIYYAVT